MLRMLLEVSGIKGKEPVMGNRETGAIAAVVSGKVLLSCVDTVSIPVCHLTLLQEAGTMGKAKERSLRCCYCCTEVLSGFLLLMLVASAFTLLRYFLEFYEPMPAYSGNKTNLSINMTTIPKPSSQSLASAEALPQSSAMTFKVSQQLTEPLTSSSPQSLISSVTSTLRQQTSPTNHLQQPTSDRRKTDFPPVPAERTTSLTFPPPFVSVTQSILLHRLTSPTKQRSPEQLLTLPVKRESPEQLRVTTEMSFSQPLTSTMNVTLSQKLTSAMESPSERQQTTAMKLSSSQTHSQNPFSGQSGENETIQYFKGSFNLVNETYRSSYGDSTSGDFRKEALKLENMISNAFAKSTLKQHYRDSSIMALKPSPFRAQFIVRMSSSIQASRLSPSTVTEEMIQGYQKTSGNGVLIDKESLQVEDPLACRVTISSWNDKNLGVKEGFSWHVTVLKDGDPACEGSMITEKWVLSTTSCVTSSDDVSLYSVQFGAEWKPALGSELYPVATIIPPSSNAQDDLVLIRLARSPPITPLIHPVCLPDPTRVAPAGTKCKSLGSKKVGDPGVLEWTVISPSGCGLSSSSTSLCAETEDLKNKIQMTAGGSFVCPGENNQLYLEGINPSTIENQGKTKLKVQSVIFTRVAPWVPWIESQVLL